MKIQYLGHAAVRIESGAYALLFDPYLTGNAMAAKKPEEVKATHIFVSHAHGDHLGDTILIAKASGAKIYVTAEMARLLKKEYPAVYGGNIGGSQKTDFGMVKLVSAIHDSGVPGGLACGFIVELENKRVYFAGDTALSAEMSLLGDEDIYLAFLPIGDLYTMGPKDALKAVRMIQPRYVVPIHYNTFPGIVQDPQEFKTLVEGSTDARVTVMNPNDICGF